MLSELESLAHEKSSDNRRELLNRVTDLFLVGADKHSNREDVLYADIVLQVIDSVDIDGRAEYADRIADSEAVPSTVVKRLVEDDIDVAYPVLSRSPVLEDEDLIAVAQTNSQDHLRAISERQSLSEQVTDHLVERGDREVVRTVTANKGARFSSVSLVRLAEKSVADPTVCSNVLRRADIRELMMEKIEPLVSEEHAEKLRMLMQQADDGVVAKIAGLADERLEKAGQSANKRLELRTMLAEARQNKRKLNRYLDALAKDDRMTDIVTMVSRLSGVSENIVSNVMFKTNNEPVAVLLRSIGVSDAAFRSVHELRARKLRLPESHVERGLQEYEELTESAAQRSLRYVKVRAAVA